MSRDLSGWMPGIEIIPSDAYGYPDVGEDSVYPRAVMSHVMQGFQNTMIGWAKERPYLTKKSATFTVNRSGRIVQHVSIWDPPWTAGDVVRPAWTGVERFGPNPNKYTVNIECEGFSIPVFSPTGQKIHDYVYDASNPWPEAMIAAVIEIHRFVFGVCANWIVPSEDTVITHSMTNTKDRVQDPGDLWLATVRPRIIAALQSAPPTPPAPPAPAHDVEGAVNDLRAAMAAQASALVKLGG